MASFPYNIVGETGERDNPQVLAFSGKNGEAETQNLPLNREGNRSLTNWSYVFWICNSRSPYGHGGACNRRKNLPSSAVRTRDCCCSAFHNAWLSCCNAFDGYAMRNEATY